VDVTGLLSGEYWLEAEIDVGGNIMESDTTNNLTRIKVQVNMPDADGDGLSDSFEQNIGLDPNRADSDGDGLNDEGEVGFDGDLQNYDPFDPVSNPGGTDTDALDVDSDDDGFRDGVEVWLGTGALDNGDFPTGLPVSGGFPLAALGIALGCIAGRALRAGAHG